MKKVSHKKIYLYLLSFILTLPIFVYYSDGVFTLGECNNITGRCPALPLGMFFLLILAAYFIVQNTYALILTIFILLFCLEYLFYNDPNLFLRTIKSLLPYIVFLGFYSNMQNRRRIIKYDAIEFFVSKALPYTIILVQVIIFLSNASTFSNTTESLWPSFIFNSIKVYNYNQYFSYILLLACGVRIFNSDSILEKVLITIFLIYSCYHSTNTTALFSSILLMIIYIALSLSNNFALIVKNNTNYFSISILSLFFILPFLNFFFLYLVNDTGIDQIPGLKGIHTRFNRYDDYLSNIGLDNLFYGIYPNAFEDLQPHNQFIEYLIFFGFLKTTILISLFLYILLNIKNFKYSIPLSIIFGLGGGLSEIVSHLYTGPLLLIYSYLCTFIKVEKNNCN
jgi:hypothetical protein